MDEDCRTMENSVSPSIDPQPTLSLADESHIYSIPLLKNISKDPFSMKQIAQFLVNVKILFNRASICDIFISPPSVVFSIPRKLLNWPKVFVHINLQIQIFQNLKCNMYTCIIAMDY